MNEVLRFKNIIIAFIIVGVFSIINYSIFTYYRQQFDMLDAKQQQLENGKATIRKWQALEKQYQDFDSVFLVRDVAIFKRFVEAQAQESGVFVVALNTANEDKGFYWEARITLDATASYRDFVEFVELLERRKIGTDGLTLSTRPDKDEVNIQATLRGVVLK